MWLMEAPVRSHPCAVQSNDSESDQCLTKRVGTEASGGLDSEQSIWQLTVTKSLKLLTLCIREGFLLQFFSILLVLVKLPASGNLFR